MSYQRSGISTGRGFGRGHGNLCGRGRGCVFNSKKPKVRGNFEALVSGIYLIGDAQQSYKCNKTTEAILNYIPGHLSEGNDIKEASE